MPKINILPAKVYNRIAAGEVVDRPYSVVKELVENAIDAGATEIEIYVEKGGKDLIRVVDNGCGIERNDLKSAFLPHATSKISKAEDLDNIMTLGFRGEAIASISAVSQMTIISKTAGGRCYALTTAGGCMGNVTEISGDRQGTDVRVKLLFYNAPVRLKFLKSDKAEEADITTFVSRFILNRSDIAFTYYVNGKKVLQSFGGGMEEALVCVYGAAIRSQCIELDAEKHGVRIRGYIGNQNFSKPNKSYQSVFLNGRYVLNSTIAAAISGAYASYLMKRQYPFYVLHITVPTEVVDVNVHPNKADVRFADNNIIYGCIYSVISAVLDGKSTALEYIVPTTEKETEEEPIEQSFAAQSTQSYTEPVTQSFADRFSDISVGEKPLEKEKRSLSDSILAQAEEENKIVTPTKTGNAAFGVGMTYEEAQKEIAQSTAFYEQREKERAPKPFVPTSLEPVPHQNGFIPLDQIGEMDPKNCVYMTKEEFERKRPAKPFVPGKRPDKLLKMFPGAVYSPGIMLRLESPNMPESEKGKHAPAQQDVFAENKQYLETLDKEAEQNKIDVTSCHYVGKLFNTYLIYEKNDEMFFIDQHAAHERLIFDRLKARMKDRKVVCQPMLVPYKLELNAFEATFIRERMKDICDIGFEMEECGDTAFQITAVPVDIPNIDLGVFFNHILGDVSGYCAIKLEDVLKDKLASAACKAAIKGGMDISRQEIDELFMQMDGNMGLKCPHGRPVVVKMTKTQLEKMFKRIV